MEAAADSNIKCGSVNADLTRIALKDLSPAAQAVKLEWSLPVTTAVRADVGGVSCESSVRVALGDNYIDISAVGYEILPLADGSGARISLDQTPIRNAIDQLFQHQAETAAAETRKKNQDHLRDTLARYGYMLGIYDADPTAEGRSRASLEVQRTNEELLLHVKFECIDETLSADVSEAGTLVTTHDNRDKLELQISPKGDTLVVKSAVAQEANFKPCFDRKIGAGFTKSR